MAPAHSLEGLMKWLRRDEWRGPLEAVLDQHLAPASAKAGIERDELPSVIDEHWFMTLWGCAFEDFLTRDLEDGRNIVDDYLKRRGWKETVSNRTYMTALRSSVMSLHEVSEIVPGESFLARDLVRGGEPVRVFERSATRSLRPWDRIAARIMEVRERMVMGGGILPFDRDAGETMLKLIRRARSKARKEAAKLAQEIGREADDSLLAEATSDTALLRAAAASFSTVWLDDLLRKLLDPPSDEIRNSDDEELLFTTVHYPLKPGTTPADIRGALGAIPALRQEGERFWNWVEEADLGPMTTKRPPERNAGGQSFITTMEDGALVLGNVEIKNRTLSLSVNSKGRAERGQAFLAPLLSGLVGTPLIETQTIEQMMASRPRSGPATPSTGLSAEDECAIIHEMLERHYTKMLEEPIPMLGDKTPLEAANTVKGRERLVDWLKLLENHSANLPARDPMAAYDFTWLWEKLGVTDLRR